LHDAGIGRLKLVAGACNHLDLLLVT